MEPGVRENHPLRYHSQHPEKTTCISTEPSKTTSTISHINPGSPHRDDTGNEALGRAGFEEGKGRQGVRKNEPILVLQKTIEEKNPNYITMTSRAAGQSGSRTRKGFAYDPQRITAVGEKPGEVHETAGGLVKNERIELLLTDIVSRLDRIEEKIDENVYPPESAIKPEFIRKVKKAHADIKNGKGKTYNSLDDFFKEIEA